MNIASINRNHGLDILRSTAIIFVFLSNYDLLTNQNLFGFFGQMGGIGVDLFFALSGYLIGHQIFSALKNDFFSLKIFYARRFFLKLRDRIGKANSQASVAIKLMS